MAETEFIHKPVLFDECMEYLAIKPDGIYVDGTAGGGGHSFGIASRLDNGCLISIDQDEDAIAAAGKRLSQFGEKSILVRDNFRNVASVCSDLNIKGIDGMLMDLGVSSYQLDCPERGFSYNADAPLDMRMDNRRSLTAFDVVNKYDLIKLKRIIYDYGEERFAHKIALAIEKAREKKPIETTKELSDIIKFAIPSAARDGGHHPAKRTFQAIRIEVNSELDVIGPAIEDAVKLLNKGGRIAIITFHSLEDRIVKQAFANLAKGCTCPKDFPVCVCGNKPKIKVITHKPIVSGEKELDENPRARSAKLRVAEKV